MTVFTDYKYVYRIDRKNNITFVDQDWLQFAQENNAPELTLENVIGANLLDYIEDIATRKLYENLFDRICTDSFTAFIPYRCDSPTEKREFEFMIKPLEDGAIEFRTKIISIGKDYNNPLLDISVPKSKQVFEICSFCKDVLFPDKTWNSLELALTRINLNDLVLPEVTNSTCPKCTQLLQKWIKAD